MARKQSLASTEFFSSLKARLSRRSLIFPARGVFLRSEELEQ